RTAGVHGSVVVDDERGSKLAIEHLLGLGHDRVGFVGLAARTDTALRREQGYRTAMDEAGVRVEPDWMVAGPATMAGGHAAVDPIISQPASARPTALFVASLLGAVGVLGRLRAAGLRVPVDISVIAFNDHELAEHLDPPLTTVRMPNLRMGQEAVRLLVSALDGAPAGDVVIDEAPRIVVRGSTGPPPGDD
ncbi:MAG: substrate-binding domain-containing protein, partial [Chloroflexota bacterium]|nr:substrate-binding domain-containing protein [Chloroflexota bacterium]